MPRLQSRLRFLVGLALVLVCFTQVETTVSAPPRRSSLVGVVSVGNAAALKQLGVDWYLSSFADTGAVPAGMHRVDVIFQFDEPDADLLASTVAAQPGSAWLIGNEPNLDSDAEYRTPKEYAVLLHRLAGIIRGADASAIIVGPNVLNWSDTCTGCNGDYQRGDGWTQAFYDAYLGLYGERPPIDRWAIHTYELNWAAPPTLHVDYHYRQLTNFRAWLDSIPAEAGRPIWNTELGFHWAYSGFHFNAARKIVPDGGYDAAGVQQWLDNMLNWLAGEGTLLGIERSFLFAQAFPPESYETVYGGLSFFTSLDADAVPTPEGRQLATFLFGQPAGTSVGAAVEHQTNSAR